MIASLREILIDIWIERSKTERATAEIVVDQCGFAAFESSEILSALIIACDRLEKTKGLSQGLESYKSMYKQALEAVDQVFQECSTNPNPILPDFLGLGDDKFKGVVRLAKEYGRQREALHRIYERASAQPVFVAEVAKFDLEQIARDSHAALEPIK